jgi:hypothetical protein
VLAASDFLTAEVWASDGFGKRYFLGPFYMILGDVRGALQSYEWFDREFPDDVGEPGQYLCWVLAHYRAGDLNAASRKFLEADLMNLYMFPALFGWEQEKREMWHGSNWQWMEYLEEIPEEYFGLWVPEEIQWAKEVYSMPAMKELRQRHIEIHQMLETEKDREKRMLLIEEDDALRNAALPGVPKSKA